MQSATRARTVLEINLDTMESRPILMAVQGDHPRFCKRSAAATANAAPRAAMIGARLSVEMSGFPGPSMQANV